MGSTKYWWGVTSSSDGSRLAAVSGVSGSIWTSASTLSYLDRGYLGGEREVVGQHHILERRHQICSRP